MAENISVCVRVRPLNEKEREEGVGWVVDHAGTRITVVDHSNNNNSASGTRTSTGNSGSFAAQQTDLGASLGDTLKSYSFDKVYDETWGTKHIYDDVCLPVVDSVVDGFNGTIFAYGQTSSGKTYTMRGSGTWEENKGKENQTTVEGSRDGLLFPVSPAKGLGSGEDASGSGDGDVGILPLAVRGIFRRIRNTPNREFLLRMSYMEIYNEDIIDLLAQSAEGPSGSKNGESGRRLLVKERANGGGPYVCGLREEIVRTEAEVAGWLDRGDRHRHVGETKMNRNSSRSHTLFQMVIESRLPGGGAAEGDGDGAVLVSKLTLVDLAGSERLSKTLAEGKRAKEGAYINKSLLTLGTVINKLSEGQHRHIPYRDSKLTRILQTALGGNSKTAMITNVTPSVLHTDETHSTLRFATRTKSVKNVAVVNEVLNDDALLKRQQREIERLRDRLKERNGGVDIEATEHAIEEMEQHLVEVKEQNKSIEEMLAQEKREKSVLAENLDEKTRKLRNLTDFVLGPGKAAGRQKRDRMSFCPSSIVRPAAALLAEVDREAAKRDALDKIEESSNGGGDGGGGGLLQEALTSLRAQLNGARERAEEMRAQLDAERARSRDLESERELRARAEEELCDAKAEGERLGGVAKSLGEEAAELRRLRSLDQEALARMEEEGERVSAALAGAREEAGDLGAKGAAMEARASSLEVERDAKAGECRALTVERDRLAAEVEDRARDLESLRERLKQSEQGQRQAERERDSAAKELERERSKVSELERDLELAAARAEDAESAAAGARGEADRCRGDLASSEHRRAAFEERCSKVESSLQRSERERVEWRTERARLEQRLSGATERLGSAVEAQTKLSEDLGAAREEKIAMKRRERQLEDERDAFEEKVQARDQAIRDLEEDRSRLEQEVISAKQRQQDAKHRASQLRQESMATEASLRERCEQLEARCAKLEVESRGRPQESERDRAQIASLEKDLGKYKSESRYWRQQTKELTEQRARSEGSRQDEQRQREKLERENKHLDRALEKSEERAESLAIRVAELNAECSAARSEAQQVRSAKLDGIGEECAGLEPKQLVVIESQGGVKGMIDSFLQNRRRMAKLQAVYNDMKAKLAKVDAGEDVFGRMKTVSELEYDLHYMANKKKAFESKYNELRRQVQSTKRPESISQRLGGKENLEA